MATIARIAALAAGLAASISVVTASGCASETADITGTAGGVAWSTTTSVYFGARYVVISQLDLGCDGVDFVTRNYDEGVAPTDRDTQVLQFAFSGDDVVKGKFAVDVGGEVQSSIVEIHDGNFTESLAKGGTFTVDEVTAETSASGSFDAVTFDGDAPGTVTGTFTAAWCRNLKP